MGNSHGLDARQREDCVPIKRGIVFVFLPRMLILWYLQTSGTCSRQAPGVSRRSYSLFNCSHADCLGHVNTDAVNHCRHRLLLLVPRYIILTPPREISHGAFTTKRWMDLNIFLHAFFCALIMAPLAWKAQLPGVRIMIILIARALCLWWDALLLSGGCVHLHSPKLWYLEGKMAQSVGNWLSVSAQWGACRGRCFYADWTGRSPRERLLDGPAGVKICVIMHCYAYFKYISSPFESVSCDAVLPFFITLQAALAGCSGEAKCHINNWAFSVTLLVCLHPLSSQLVVILKHIDPIPAGATLGLMVWALTNHMSVLCTSPPLTHKHTPAVT